MAKSEWRKSVSRDPVSEQLQTVMPTDIARPSRSLDSEKFDQPVRRRRTLDPLTEQLGCSGYMMNAHFDWLSENMETYRRALTVERYYQEMKIAVDLGQNPVSERDQEIKRKLCSDNGVHYYFCKNSRDIEKMISESLSREMHLQKGRH